PIRATWASGGRVAAVASSYARTLDQRTPAIVAAARRPGPTRRPGTKAAAVPEMPRSKGAEHAVARAFASTQGEAKATMSAQPTVTPATYTSSSAEPCLNAKKIPASAATTTARIKTFVTAGCMGEKRKSPAGQIPKNWSLLSGWTRFPNTLGRVKSDEPVAWPMKTKPVARTGTA